MEDGNLQRADPHAVADLPQDGVGRGRGRAVGVPRALQMERAISVMHVVALGFLTYNSGVAAYRARSDPWTLVFVVSAYGALMLLFWCLRAFEAASAERKERLKLAIWLLVMTLNAMFSYRVASMMPFGFAVVIWVIAGVATVAGFYMFFVWGGEKGSTKGTP